MSKKGVLLINLGSPNSTKVSDVRKYLKEFLSDPRVIDTSAIMRSLVLNLFILPFRPKNTADAYSRIWEKEGSPLILMSKKQQHLLKEKTDIPIYLSMRYGSPSISETLIDIESDGINELFIIPLYPHYAMSSYETVEVKVNDELKRLTNNISTKFLPPFYNHPEYIDALIKRSEPFLKNEFDLLLFSFHGIPERHLRKSDPSHSHCLTCENCCEVSNPAHATCYRHQCFQTVKYFVTKANIPKDKYAISFQSRLGRDPWLKPYTDFELKRFAEEGTKKLLIISPAFVSDCLETLEELGMEGKEIFESAGGQNYQLIPCLNDHPSWINYLSNQIENFKNSNSN